MFSKLPEYLEWANGRTLASMESIDAPGESLAGVLGHVVAAEEHWFARLGGGETELANWPKLSLSELRIAIRRNAETCRSILRSSADRGLTEWIVSYENSSGERFEQRASDIFMHVFAHGAYHRGQIATAIKRAGGRPAVTDYIAYCRKG